MTNQAPSSGNPGRKDQREVRLRGRAGSLAISAHLPPEARLAAEILQSRRKRERVFGANLFADPAWDMLLDLFVSRLRHHPVCVSSLCIAARVPPTTALRWIRNMEVHGELVRRRDPHDGRRVFMEISDAAFDAVARTLQPSCEERSSVNAGSGLSG